MVLSRSRLRFRLLGVAVVCGLVMGSVGCTASSHPGRGPEPTIGAVPIVDGPSLVSRPIDAYLASAPQIKDLARVSLTAMNNCLEKRGVTGRYSISGQGGLDGFVKIIVDDRVIRGDLWGFFGVDTAGTDGYSHPGGAGAGSLQIAAPPGVDADNTCAKAGQDALGGRSWLDFATPASLPDGGPTVPTSDSRWVAAAAAWSACMKAKGFSYATPLAAISDVAWRGTTVTATQIATATADVSCKISTNLIGTGMTVQAAYDRQYIDAHRTQLDTAVTQRDNYLRAGGQSE
jgi:hypothetical protein